MAPALLFSVLIVSTCGLVYELISATLASYLLGDSVTQFSTVIGAYLSAMGVGSYLSRFIKRDLLVTFVRVEILVGLIGGVSAALLFAIFNYAYSFRVVLYVVVFIIGILVGLEIPLLMRVLKDRLEFSDLVSRVLSFDYIGALIASILFPLVLVPFLGLLKTCFLFGMLNVLVGMWAIVLFQGELPHIKLLTSTACTVLVLLVLGFVYSERMVSFAESNAYAGKIIFAKSTPYQRIVISESEGDVRLYLNGHLQFSSLDEYRYHEALVHPGLWNVSNPQKVLVLGGGDGFAVRELLRHPLIQEITVVDLDQEVTTLFRENELFARLNNHAFASHKVSVVNQDAFLWLHEQSERYDFVVIDLPDPTNYSLGKLYSTTFYRSVYGVLNPEGLVVVQSTSPLLARKSYWCISETLEQAGFLTVPYHTYVPSFGEWGFVLAGKREIALQPNFPSGLRFMSAAVFLTLRSFPTDMSRIAVEPNRLDNQILTRYYDEEWSRYSG